MLGPILFSSAITASQTISKIVPLSVIDTNLVRFAAVGSVCAVFMLLAPQRIEASYATLLLNVLTGCILFFASALYIHLVRTDGIVATCVTTTAFSFLLTVLVGCLLLKEKVTLKTIAAMAIVMSGVVLYHI